ncbi:MAG: hypothetical protein DRQ44_13990 [Gammaproteobacteria bacterium]|nr:MAG: hypothetical protein DRQ44_13990 [Gammaproteobacteria bacterium]
MNNDETSKKLKKNRIILIFLGAFFALPYLVVFIYQSYPDLSEKTGMSNKGDLFSPVHSIEKVATADFDEFKGKWTIIYISGASCDQACFNQHFTMRQVRLASAKRRYKIERLNLITTGTIDDDYNLLLSEFPNEKQIFLQSDNNIMQNFDELTIEEQLGRVYLMDPFLNIVLRYPAQVNPKDLLHDIIKIIPE